MNKIYTGNDRAHELKLKNYRDLIHYLCKKSGERWNGQLNPNAEPVTAFIDWGRWAWQCECGNGMYAEPSDPIGFCDQCGNVFTGGDYARPVLFPENRKEIEVALLEREVEGSALLMEKFRVKHGGTQLAMMAQFRPATLPRNWKGESVAELKEEHGKAKERKEKNK